MRLIADWPRGPAAPSRIVEWVRRGVAVTLAILLVGILGLAQERDGGQADRPPVPTRDGPLAPDQAPRSFRVQPGLRVELVAAEPLIASPVAMAFDERGRLYVVENRGYPTGPGPGQPPAGRIALLEDTDHDGRMDKRSEYLDGLGFPNGVMPWKGGLIVTCAPDVLYVRDTDGDGKADERRVLFTGFDTTGSTQLRVSHPTLSIDNWVYVTSGLKGGKIISPSAPDRPPVVLTRADFRFRPDGNAWEASDGGAQFGLTFDDFGHRFICYNRVQVQHVVISAQTLRRNPHLAFSGTVQNCPVETVPEPLKGHGAAARLFPISRNVTTADSHAGTFTAACAVTVFRGTGLPNLYRGDVFSCDPTGNLVHVDRLGPRGATFEARPATQGSEFFASSDNWCRPVFLASGPDGALYFCDMYRKTIEHPDYLPAEIRKRTDFESGKTMGRIWRIVRDDLKTDDLRRLRQVDLAGATLPELCQALNSPDGWRVDTAHRLLLERRDHRAIVPLRDLARSPRTPAVAVAHALRLLEALDGLDGETLRRLVVHPSAGVREQVLQLIEPRLAREPGWATEVLNRAEDENPRVRFEAAIDLGAVPAAESPAKVAGALAGILARDGADRWLRAAVFSSLSGREDAFLTALRDRPRQAGATSPDSLKELGRLLGASRSREEWPGLIRLIVAEPARFSPEEQAALLTGLAEAARGRISAPGPNGVLASLVGSASEDRSLAESIRSLVATMRDVAGASGRPLEARTTAVGLLAFAGYDDAASTLLGLVQRDQPIELQVAAVRALGIVRDDRVAAALLDPARFASYTPAVRDEVLSALVAQAHHLPGLLTALENQTVPTTVIDALRRRQLSQHRDPAVRRRAEALFGTVSGDRAKVYEDYKDVATWKADPSRGQAVFRRECASCHRLDREGFAVGPDLFGVRNQPKPAILLHILVPDHEITQGFTAYTVATTDGRVLTGLIASESPTSLTLRQPLGKEDTILRSDVEELAASKQSLMPQGLEKNISRQEFADLLAYLKGEGDRPREDSP